MTKTFVNRTAEMARLHQAVKNDGQECQMLIFTGIGGMGKTALRLAFEEQVLIPNKVPYAVVDYDSDLNLLPIEATLRAIRRQLERHGIRTPVFDFLYARYFELSTGLKLSQGNVPPELSHVVAVLAGIPIVGNVTQILHGLTQLGLSAKERLQHKEWLYRLRDLEPREILNLLPEVMGEDLEEAMLLQSSKVSRSRDFRISLFLDAYERLAELQVDDTLHRKLLFLTPHLFRVILTRDPLPWEHRFPNEWRGRIIQSSPLESLPQEDAEVFLKEKGVDQSDLRNHLYQLTGGYPFHLELCTDIYREISETGAQRPGIQDFQVTAQTLELTEELMRRLLRQLKDDERDLMGLASYPRWISEEILEVLSSSPESVLRIFRRFNGLSIFSPHPEIPGALILRKEIRDSLISQHRRGRLWKERHEKLSQFHRERFEETQSFHYLLENLYHGFYGNPEEALKIFEENFWKLLERFRFGEAESLLEAIPIETLDEKTKRKADYARARLFVASIPSPHSLETAKHLYETLIASETDEGSLGQYLFSLGSLLEDLGEYGRALEAHEKSLAISLKIHGEEHPDVARSYNHVGTICWRKGEYTKALEFHEKSLAIFLKLHGEKHPSMIKSYNDIGAVYGRKGEYRKALEFHEKSLALGLWVHGEEHPDVARSQSDIGVVYWRRSDYGKALEYFEKSLAIRFKIYGEEHPDVSRSYHNIGAVYSEEGEYGKALEYFEKSLAIRRKIYGEEHPDVGVSHNNIGAVYWKKGEYGKALEYFEKGLVIRQKVHGEEHPDVAMSYNNIGAVYSEEGDYGKALEYHEKSLFISRKVYGEEHPDVETSYNNLGTVYWRKGEYEKALEFHGKSLAIGLKVHGEEHPDVAQSYNDMGVVYADQGEYEKALEYFEKSLLIRRKIYGEKHPDVGRSYREIASTLWSLKKKEEALPWIRQSAEISREFRLWKDAVKGFLTLATWLEKLGKVHEAEEARAEAHRLREN